jgi:hypothetical protein
MSLKDSQLSWVLAALLAAAALVEYNVMSITFLETNITPFATWIFLGTITGAYILSQRELNQLTDWEMGAFIVAIGGFAAYQFLPQVQSIIADYQPHSGVLMFGATMVAFYILTNEDI